MGYIEKQERINQTDEKGNKQGMWKEFYPDGTIKKETRFIDGVIDGYVKDYDKKGDLSEMKKFVFGDVATAVMVVPLIPRPLMYFWLSTSQKTKLCTPASRTRLLSAVNWPTVESCLSSMAKGVPFVRFQRVVSLGTPLDNAHFMSGETDWKKTFSLVKLI